MRSIGDNGQNSHAVACAGRRARRLPPARGDAGAGRAGEERHRRGAGRSCAPTRTSRPATTKKVLDLVETKVLPHFNFTSHDAARGRPQLGQATPEQQKALVAGVPHAAGAHLHHGVHASTATRRSSTGRSLRARRHRRGGEVARSSSRRPAGRRWTTAWRRRDTGWKVYDVKIEGISLVENYRSTFNTEVQKGGIDGLIKTLADKNKQLARPPARNDLVHGRPLHRAGAGHHRQRRGRCWTQGERGIAGARRSRSISPASPRSTRPRSACSSSGGARRPRQPHGPLRQSARQPEEPRRALRRHRAARRG